MAPRSRPFTQVDVFTDVPYLGNPVAVVHDADGLTTAEMQAFARWTNLSETTFLLPPTPTPTSTDSTDASSGAGAADYKLRIFTPGEELPFAGHPTLGSAHAWLQAGGKPRDPKGQTVVQECGVGLVRIRLQQPQQTEQAESSSPTPAPARLALAAPPLLRSGPVERSILERACKAMGLDAASDVVVDAAWIVNGPRWFAVQLRDARAVLDVKIQDLAQAADLEWGIVGLYPQKEDAGPEGSGGGGSKEKPLLEIRTFVPSMGVPEDPVTGSFK